MPVIDEFASSLLEEAKQFLEKSSAGVSADGRDAYLHAAVLLAFCSLEAHVYAISEDFAEEKTFTPHEIGLLQERAVRLEDGEFTVKSTLQIARLEDRIQFLHRKFAGVSVKSEAWWSDLMAALAIRNQLTHPKVVPNITVDAVERAIHAIIEALNTIYKAVYKRPFPAASRGLHSRLTF